VTEIKTLDDLRYKVDHNLLTEDEKAEYDDEDLQKLVRGEKVKIKGLGKQSAGEESNGGSDYAGMKKEDLQAELATRVDENDQPYQLTGTNDELIKRLEANDEL
jgi:hypothetical protein